MKAPDADEMVLKGVTVPDGRPGVTGKVGRFVDPVRHTFPDESTASARMAAGKYVEKINWLASGLNLTTKPGPGVV